MPPKKDGSPDKGNKKGSPDKKKGSPDKKGSPSKKGAVDVPDDEEEVIVEVPYGIMNHRMRFLLKNELKADITFNVGTDNAVVPIKAHKCVLSAESPVFEKLFADIEAGRTKEAEEAAEALAKETADAKAAGKKGGKGSPDKTKGSPDKKEKKGSPDKKSPDKKSPDKKSPDKKAGKGKSPDKQELPQMDFKDDIVVNDKEINVPDVHPDGFFKILRYIYHDEIVLNGVVGVLRTMYAARKYMLPILYKACIEYLERNVSIEHVLKLLKASLDFHEEKLKGFCMELIINETFEVINREEFTFVDHRIIDLILEQDILNCREIELFDRVMHWAENQCEKIGILVTAKNQRVALGVKSMEMIRFPTIVPHEFATHVVPTGILKTDEEIVPILSYHITGRPPPLPYSCKIRRRPCLDIDKLETQSITFSEDTDITFVGYDAYPRRTDSFKDLTIPIGVLGPPKHAGLGLYPRDLYRTTSIPDRFNVNDEQWENINYNIKALKVIDDETRRYEYAKRNLVLLRSHYR